VNDQLENGSSESRTQNPNFTSVIKLSSVPRKRNISESESKPPFVKRTLTLLLEGAGGEGSGCCIDPGRGAAGRARQADRTARGEGGGDANKERDRGSGFVRIYLAQENPARPVA